ncbi:MAG TPA: efflux RND transporter periplasmic adaptor subunit [Anaerolineales bacterium]
MKHAKIIASAALCLLVAACSSTNGTPAATAEAVPTVLADDVIVAEGRVEPLRFAQIALNASGLISEVLVPEGAQVSAGDVIARLENAEAQTLEAAQASALQELTSAYQEVRDAQFKLDNFDVPSDFAGQTPTEAVEQTLTKLNAARAAYEPYRYRSPNSKNGKEFEKRLDDAWADYRKAIQWMELESNAATARARLELAQKDSDSLQDPAFTEDTAGARAALANAEVRAPFAGTITDLNLKVGEFAASGEPVVTIADLSQWVVKTTDLTEIDVVNLSEGQPVTVTLDAIPSATLKGHVFSIGQSYSEVQGDIVYEVTVLLTEQPPAMRWGMTAEVKFEK